MQNIKVLQLENWMKSSRSFVHEYYNEIEPVFNRDGVYLAYKICWFEVRGKAYLYDEAQFRYDLQLLHDLEVCKRKVKLIRELAKENMATKDQKRILYAHDYCHYDLKRRLDMFRRHKCIQERCGHAI